jgi:competence protein ComEA
MTWRAVCSLVLPVLFLRSSVGAELPDGPGKEVIVRACSRCHKAEDIPSYRHTKDEWPTIIDRMIQRGAAVADGERDMVVNYLVTNFLKEEDPSKINVNKATAKELETGLELTAKEAEAIVDYRERHGNFRVWGDLLVIYGVDGKKIQAAKDRMSF